MKRTKISEIFKHPERIELGSQISVKGWVRTKRGNNTISFIALNDGSIVHNIQIVAENQKFDEKLIKNITTGASLHVIGRLVESQGKGQAFEIQADSIEVYGTANPETYPLQKKGHSMEFLREIAHLRPRTNYFGCILRLRHAMAYAIHKYFNDNGFYYMHTPLITGSDAEGAGAMFAVTTLDLQNIPKTPREGQLRRRLFRKPTFLTVRTIEGNLELWVWLQSMHVWPYFQSRK